MLHFREIAFAIACTCLGCERGSNPTLTLSGSTSLQPLAEKWADAYHAQHPEVSIAVQGGGSTAGVQATISGAAQVGMVSRALTSAERRVVDAVPVARDGIALVVHPSNPLADVSPGQVRAVYAGRIENWEQLAGPQLPITVITREEGSGTRAAFESTVMRGDGIASSALVQDSTGAVRQMVSDDPAAIGYISIGLVDSTVKALRLNGSEPNERNIDNGTYLLVRPFSFAVRGKPVPTLAKFIAWVVGPEGNELARREGMLPAAESGAHATP
jgi:phosphate transport system substrate-binding protein